MVGVLRSGFAVTYSLPRPTHHRSARRALLELPAEPRHRQPRPLVDLALGERHLPAVHLRVAPVAARVHGAEQVVHLAEHGETARARVEVLRPPHVDAVIRA